MHATVPPHALTSAVFAYTGYGEATTPRADRDAVLALAEGEAGVALLATVARLVAESETIEADWDDAEDGSLVPVFAREFSLLHPDLPDEVLRALSWYWAYDRFR